MSKGWILFTIITMYVRLHVGSDLVTQFINSMENCYES
jgi:hypothetical protein